MFSASRLGRLLLGNAALIILGGLILLRVNGLDENDRKPARPAVRPANRPATTRPTVASVRRSAANLPQLNSFNGNFNKKDTYVNWTGGLRKWNAPRSRPNDRSWPIHETTEHRLKRSSPPESSSGKSSANSINQAATIRSDNANDREESAEIVSGRPATPTQFGGQTGGPAGRRPTKESPLSNEEEANELQIINNYTNDITKLAAASSTAASAGGRDLTNYKSSTNIGYKYYDPMRKHGQRPAKDPNLVGWNSNWNGLLKLIFLLLSAGAGTTGNIFVISSIMIIDQFQMQGNIYLVSLALAQLLISIIAVPATCIEIMAAMPNHPEICQFQLSLSIFTCVIIFLSFMLISLENVSALRRGSLSNHNLFCSKFRIIFLVLLSWTIAGLLAFTQRRYRLAPALCQHELNKRQHIIWPQYHLTVIVSVFILPTLITMLCFLKCALRVKRINIQLENNPLDSPWQLVMADGELVKANMIVYFFTFICWLPICILSVLSAFKHVSIELINTGWWLAWTNSLTYPYLYSCFNLQFGKTFSKLFWYCCCKSHLSIEGKTAMNFRRIENATASGTNNMELRVHLIPGLNMNQRRDDYLHLNSGAGTGSVGIQQINKCNKYGTVTVGRSTRSIPASDGGLGFGGGQHNVASSAQHSGGGFHKWDSRVDSDAGSSNYSGNPLHRSFGGSRSYSHSNSYSSHLVDDAAYEYGHAKRYSGQSGTGKYFI